MDTNWGKGEFVRKKPVTDDDKVVMANYMEAGLRAGRRREDLLYELSKGYERSTRQIERYISEVEVITAKPNLTIEYNPESLEDPGIYTFDDGQKASFCCVQVWNKGKDLAENCLGTLKLISLGDKNGESYYNLHWAFDDPYLYKDVPRSIDIPPGHASRLDVVFALPPSQKETSELSNQTTTSGKPYPIEVPYEQPSSHCLESKVKGCWIATHLALRTHIGGDQYHLAPGEHLAKVEVSCDEGGHDEKYFKIISPKDWRKLTMELVDFTKMKT